MKSTVLFCLALLFCLPSAFAADASAKKKIIFIAGKPSHGYGQHEHNAGCLLLAKALGESMSDKLEIKVYNSTPQASGWPADPSALNDAAAIIMYCDGGNGHMALAH